VTCPHCGSAVAVPDETRRALEAYRNRADAELRREAALARDAAWFRQMSGPSPHPQPPDRQSEPVASIPVRCANCGATNELTAGRILATCSHCNAPLLPSPEARDQGLSAAQHARRRREIELARREREAWQHVATTSGAAARTVAWTLGTAAFLGLVLLGWNWLPASGAAETSNRLRASLPWAGATALLLAGTTVVLRTRARKRRWQAALEALARRVGGRTLAGLDDERDWLDRYWADRSGPLAPSQAGGALEFSLAGFPTLLAAGVGARGRTGRDAFLECRVAAWIPNVSDRDGLLDAPPPQATPGREALAGAGYSITAFRPGFVVRADEPVLAELRRRPEALLEFHQALGEVLRVAAAYGARPAPPVD